jgi:hypothetical protein
MRRKEKNWNSPNGVLKESWEMLRRGAADSNDPFHYFAAIACRIDSMDFLVLRILGNRRARFDWNETGMNAKWLIP